MAKKIVKAESTSSKSNIDIAKIAKTISENKDAIEKIADGVSDLVGKKSSKTTKTTKTKKSTKSDGLSKAIDIASSLLK